MKNTQTSFMLAGYKILPALFISTIFISTIVFAKQGNPKKLFSYEPANAVVSWVDAKGIHSGSLSIFNSTADKKTVYSINLQGRGITKLVLRSDLPNLRALNYIGNSVTVAPNTSGCPHLGTLYFDDNLIVNPPDISTLSELRNYSGNNNPFPANTRLDTSHNLLLSTFQAYGTKVNMIDISNNRELLSMDFGGNPFTSNLVDEILHQLVMHGKTGGSLALYGTAKPSEAAGDDIATLLSRGWEMQLD